MPSFHHVIESSDLAILGTGETIACGQSIGQISGSSARSLRCGADEQHADCCIPFYPTISATKTADESGVYNLFSSSP